MDYQESTKNKSSKRRKGFLLTSSQLICMIHLDMFAQYRSKPKHGQFVSQLFPHNIYQIADFRERAVSPWNLWWLLEFLAWVQNQDSGREIFL